MAEHAVVTDTHPLLYYAAGSSRLGREAAAIFAAAGVGDAIVYVPTAVVMEIVFLTRAGKSGLRVRPADFFHTLFLNPAFQPMELTPDQVIAAGMLRFNTDPFDALVVVAARQLELPLVTRDAAIVESQLVEVLW